MRAAEPVALRAEVRVELPVLRAAICPKKCESYWIAPLMNGLTITARRFVFIPRSFQEGAEVLERDASVDLGECTLYDVLQVRGAQRTASIESEQVAPRLGREPPSFVRTQDAEVHEKERLGVKGSET